MTARQLQRAIRLAARRVLKAESALIRANERYSELCSEARRHGVDIPKTPLTNPLRRPR